MPRVLLQPVPQPAAAVVPPAATPVTTPATPAAAATSPATASPATASPAAAADAAVDGAPTETLAAPPTPAAGRTLPLSMPPKLPKDWAQYEEQRVDRNYGFVRLRLEMDETTLTVQVQQGRDLRAMDSNGKSDPYVKMFV